MTDFVETPSTNSTPPPVDYYTEKKKKVKDFWLGFLGSIFGNSLLVLLYIALLVISAQTSQADNLTSTLVGIATVISNLLPWVLTLTAIIYFLVKRRRWVTFGILTSFVAAFILAILIGMAVTVWCFIGSSFTG